MRTMLSVTSTANAHQPKSARLGLFGAPTIPNRSQASCPNSHAPTAAAHSVQRARLGPVAVRRAISVPASAAIAADVQATSHHRATSEVSSVSSIATTLRPAGIATGQDSRGVLNP